MHMASITPDMMVKMLHWQFFHSLIVTIGISLVKLSVAFFLLRLVPGKKYKMFLYGMISKFTSSCKSKSLNLGATGKGDQKLTGYVSSLPNGFHNLLRGYTHLVMYTNTCQLGSYERAQCEMFHQPYVRIHWFVQ
jgi:hypothetical protein